MIDLILYDLTSQSILLAVFFIILFISGIVLYLIASKFNLKTKKVKLYGLLLEIADRDAFTLSVIIVRVFLIIYFALIYQSNIEMALALIGIISIIYIVFNRKNIIYETVNSVSIMAVIYFIHILSNYVIEITNSSAVQIIKLSLIAFITMYTIYILLREIEDIVSNNTNINE